MKSVDFKQLVKDYFSFTRSERKGMKVLCFLLFVVVILNQVADYIDFKKPADQKDFLTFLEKAKQREEVDGAYKKIFFCFNPNTISEEALDSLNIPMELKRNLIRYRSKGGFFRKPDDLRRLYTMNDSLFRIIYPWLKFENKNKTAIQEKKQVSSRKMFTFNPNTVTEEELKILGFSPFQVKNLTAYRNKGGKFLKKADLRKVYGMDSLIFQEIRDWIILPENNAEMGKVKEMPVIELNQSDSASLVSLPGIGPVFAGRIIRYRKFLGGYYTIDQLLEIYGMTGDKLQLFKRYLEVDQSLIVPLRINFADSRALSMHPYISGQQGRQIVAWRSANGPYSQKEVLLSNNILDSATFRKAEHYLSCQ